MNVDGYHITDETIDRALHWFPPDRAFTLADLTGALVRFGVPPHGYIANRCADRTLQRARKSGTHTYSGGLWRRVRSDDGSGGRP